MKTWRLMVWWLALSLARPAMAEQPSLFSLMTNGVSEPYGAVVDDDNNAYISDNSHRVFKYVYDNGSLTVLAGQQGQIGTNGGPGFLSRFFSPRGLALFGGGLVVADSGNHALRLISLTGGAIEVVTSFAGVASTNSAGTASATPVPASLARFNAPLGLTATPDGAELLVADSKNNAIRRVYFDAFTGVYMVQTLSITFVDPVKPFFEPSDVALGEAGVLFVSDTRNQYIRQLIRQADGSYKAFCLAGSVQQIAGTNDAYFARDARFSLPVGLRWVGGTTGLLIADSGNHTIRKAFIDANLSAFFGSNVWSVTTYAGAPKQPGLTDGYLDTARLKAPTQIVQDHQGGLLVVDSGNNALRRIQIETVQPPVPTPKIGYVIFVLNADNIEVSKLVTFTNAIFYDDVILAVAGEQETMFYQYGASPALGQPDTVPIPTKGNKPTPYYVDGMRRNQVPASIIPRDKIQPNLTIKAVGIDAIRRPSPVLQAQVRFKVASPVIDGDNPLSLHISDSTTDANIYYTLDYDPQNLSQAPADTGNLIESDPLSLPISANAVLSAQARRPGWIDSEVVRVYLSPTNFTANRISLGFASGEASSRFIASPGQHFYAPVTLTLLPEQKIYSMQFNVRLASLPSVPSAPPINPATIDFTSMLKKPDPDHAKYYLTIPPWMFVTTATGGLPNNLVKVDGQLPAGVFNDLNWSPDSSLLMAGWLERIEENNLYNTKVQDLVTFSLPHNYVFLSSDRKVVVGACGFDVPMNAGGSQYLIQIGRPSATADGLTADCFIDAPTNGPVLGGVLGGDQINAVKHLVIGSPRYLVGDTVPFHWLNAGEFGDTNLVNNDVFDVFQSAAYHTNIPPANSDFYDAMDSASSGVPLVDVTDGSDHGIDNMTLGDGKLDVDDIYVTYRRALDPTLKWYVRWRDASGLHAAAVPNTFHGVRAALPARKTSIHEADLPADISAIRQSTAAPAIRFTAGDLQARAGQTVTIPIQARIAGPLPIRTLLLNLDVVPCNGAPPLLDSVVFLPAPGLGAPEFSSSMGPGNFAGVWLDTSKAGVWGDTAVGTLTLKIPSQASTSACYRVVFAKVSASPSGLGLFPQTVQNGLVSLGDVSLSSWADGIPDAWRWRYFGSLTDPRSSAMSDPDGDGVSNWAEYRAGTDPTDANSALRLQTRLTAANQNAVNTPQVALHWQSVEGKRYLVEAAASLQNPSWTTLGSALTGTGADMEFVAPDIAANPVKYYRLRVAESNGGGQ